MTHSKSVDRPAKPYADFPLHAHPSGQWAKKIGGKRVYFGSWTADPEGKDALRRYHEAVSGVPLQAEGLTIEELCNRFNTVKEDAATAGTLVWRSYKAYKGVADALVEHFGKIRVVETLTPSDFEGLKKKAAETMDPVSVGNFVNIVRMVFRYGYEVGRLDRPVRFGPTFKRPSRKVLRVVRAKQGERMFEPGQIKALLAVADVQMKAMILLGANCGFGNADCGQLPLSAVDLKTGWVRFPRPKTGIDRRCPLWPETVEALREVIANRRTAKSSDHAGLLFITKYGDSWHKAEGSDNPITQQFKKLLRAADLYRKGLGFYCLRRGFETIGGDTGDQVATDFVMGHAAESRDMASIYRQKIFDERLRKVTDHVRAWLYPPEEKKPAQKKPSKKKLP